jgi:hypothetical protein
VRIFDLFLELSLIASKHAVIIFPSQTQTHIAASQIARDAQIIHNDQIFSDIMLNDIINEYMSADSTKATPSTHRVK